MMRIKPEKTMRLTTFSDYTLRVLIYLAVHPERLSTIPEIARAYDISESHLTKVVHQLARSGLIESLRGKGGGIRLAYPADSIRLGHVVRMSEGSGAIVECLATDESGCCIAKSCKLGGILTRAFEKLYEELDRFSLSDLIDDRKTEMAQALVLMRL